MIKSISQLNNQDCRSKKIASMGKRSVSLINKLYSPIDAVNRFINLALQTLDDGSQSRQFLIESKKGIRKTSALLRRLNDCVKKIEAETREISTPYEQPPPVDS